MTISHIKPDTALKTFWRDNARFADLFNAALFSGKQILDPSSLTVDDTDLSSLFSDKRSIHTLQRAFDIVKKTANGIDYVIFAMENQQNIHYAMPLRHMLNDALSYYREYTEIALRNTAAGKYSSGAEFLSRFKKTDKLHPVISLCVYYGEVPWDGPVSLKDMLQIPAGMESLVTDYQMHLIQIQTSENLHFHHPDVQAVFKICKSIYDKNFNTIDALYNEYNLTPELGIVIGSIVGSQRLINYAAKANSKGGTSTMWKVLEEWETECEERGKRTGALNEQIRGIRILIQTFKDFHLDQAEAIKNLHTKYEISEEDAAHYIQQYW